MAATVAPVRVAYGDTDQMGVVYYANYLRYFEIARAEYLRARGRTYATLEQEGWLLPVVEAHVRYRAPARYDDLLGIETRVEEARGAHVRFAYRVLREGALLAEGHTVHACLDRAGRPRRLAPELAALLGD